MKGLFLISIFLGWFHSINAEWSLIDDFEGEQLDGLDILTTANLRGDFKPVYTDDPSGAFSKVFYSRDYEQAGVVSLVFPLAIEEKVEAGSIGTIFLRYYPIVNDADIVASFGFEQIEVGIGEGAGLAEEPFLFAGTFGDIEKLIGTDLINPVFIEKRWYEIWLVVDRSEGVLETYYRRMGSDQIIFNGASDFSQSDSGDRFDHFFWSSTSKGASYYEPLFNGEPWFIDDIYIDTSGKNLTSPDGVRQPDRLWSGYAVYDGEVNTLDWLGWLSLRADSSWAWSYGLENWLYFPEPEESQSGGWAYLRK